MNRGRQRFKSHKLFLLSLSPYLLPTTKEKRECFKTSRVLQEHPNHPPPHTPKRPHFPCGRCSGHRVNATALPCSLPAGRRRLLPGMRCYSGRRAVSHTRSFCCSIIFYAIFCCKTLLRGKNPRRVNTLLSHLS